MIINGMYQKMMNLMIKLEGNSSIGGYMDKVLFSSSIIQDKLKLLGQVISKNYDEITLLVALTGGVYTAIDLSKYITIPVKLEFVKISSYGNDENSSIVDLKWISVDRGNDLGNVLIVDDICDTGKTLDYLIKYIKNNYKYNSLRTLTLLDKPSRRTTDVKVDFSGFLVDNVFVYGYGLDDKGYDRNKLNIYHKQ